MTQDTFIAALVATAEADDRVIGLVLAGSSAETARRDQWSDHDFLLITVDGAQEGYRTDLTWLPDNQDIAFRLRETAHGLKVLYRSGLLIEFAVFDRAEFATCALNHYAVVIDRGGIAELSAQVRARSLAARPIDRLREFHLLLCLLYIGTGRARRGERLSAGVFVRTYATEHLVWLLRDLLPVERRTPLDDLDVWRRVEAADPILGAALDSAVALPVEEAARALLDLADAELGVRWPEYPRDDTALVRSLLGW